MGKKRKESLTSEISEQLKRSDDDNTVEKTKHTSQSKKEKLENSKERTDVKSLKKDQPRTTTLDNKEIRDVMEGGKSQSSPPTQQSEKKKSKKKKKEKKEAKKKRLS